MIFKKFYLLLLEIRDILKQIEGNTSAEMLTVDLISRNPRLQPLVASHNAPAESSHEGSNPLTPRKSKKKGSPSNLGYTFISGLAKRYEIPTGILKDLLTLNSVPYSTKIPGKRKIYKNSLVSHEYLNTIDRIVKDYKAKEAKS